MKYDGKKEIKFTHHARERLEDRGTDENEVIQAIKECEWQIAKRGKLECKRSFLFHSRWEGKFYAIKEVRPILADEANAIVVIFGLYIFQLTQYENLL